jgi:hypothetical protein
VSWCEAPHNYDKCYLRSPEEGDDGRVSSARMGHALVDPDP